MSDWLLNLPVVVDGRGCLCGHLYPYGRIYWVVTTLAVNDRARAFKAVSPGMLPTLGILFALLVGFIAVEVWGNFDKAKVAVRLRPAPFALSFCSPELSPKNRSRASMLCSTVT